MANNSDTRKWEGFDGVLAVVGLMVVMAAGIVFIVAGVLTSDTFSGAISPAQLARDHGVAGSIGAWALPLALSGIATVFSAVAVALTRIRSNILGRRDALVHALPHVLQPTK